MTEPHVPAVAAAAAAHTDTDTNPLRNAPWDFAAVRRALIEGDEIALLDVREEDPFAQAHPLWAANMPLSQLELQAWSRIPRRDTTIVVYGAHEGEDLAPRAAERLRALGYRRVHVLAGGLKGWQDDGGEVFRDVNVPSKAFGELVEEVRHTPSLSAQQVQALIQNGQAGGPEVVVVDARRFDEHRTMTIPTSTSVPGAELVLRLRALAPDPATQVIVHCAGRTRSIISTQSLINAGVPNPVAALRNGTIGWLLAGQTLDHGANRAAPQVSEADRALARYEARAVADRAGVRQLDAAGVRALDQPGRTTYRFDVRTAEEFAAGHLPDFISTPGGQLVQETDHHAPVRGARIVLADDADGTRACMTGSWLAQMGWEVWVLAGATASGGAETGPSQPILPAAPAPLEHPPARSISAAALAAWIAETPPDALSGQDRIAPLQILDFSASAAYVQRHIPGAWFVIRAQLQHALRQVGPAACYVLTGSVGQLVQFVLPELQALLGAPSAAQIFILTGGNAAWIAAGLPVETGESRLAIPRSDRYRRPYEGTDAPRAAMQGYLDWEFGLTAQLARDGTHNFQVL